MRIGILALWVIISMIPAIIFGGLAYVYPLLTGNPINDAVLVALVAYSLLYTVGTFFIMPDKKGDKKE